MKLINCFKKNITIILYFILSSFTLHTYGQNISFTVELSPMGSFTANAKNVTGSISKSGSVYSGENIILKVADLKTGIELRDKHLKEKQLEMSKFPEITMLKAKGANGKGVCLLKVKNVQEKVNFTFKEDKKKINFEMKLSLKKFKFAEISYLGVSVQDEVSISGDIPLK